MKKVLSAILVLLIMCSMVACGDVEDSAKETTLNIIASATKPAVEATTPITQPATEDPVETTTPATTEGEKDDGIDPDFKAAMDSYEAFFDEYVAIMKKYKENPMDMSILADYAKYMGQYADMMQKIEALENEDLNIAEAAYYAEVMARISKKLLEVA